MLEHLRIMSKNSQKNPHYYYLIPCTNAREEEIVKENKGKKAYGTYGELWHILPPFGNA